MTNKYAVKMTKIRPFKLLQWWILLLTCFNLVVIVFSRDSAMSQNGMTSVFISVFVFFVGVALWCIVVPLLYFTWFKKHWIVVILLLGISIWYTVGTYKLQH